MCNVINWNTEPFLSHWKNPPIINSKKGTIAAFFSNSVTNTLSFCLIACAKRRLYFVSQSPASFEPVPATSTASTTTSTASTTTSTASTTTSTASTTTSTASTTTSTASTTRSTASTTTSTEATPEPRNEPLRPRQPVLHAPEAVRVVRRGRTDADIEWNPGAEDDGADGYLVEYEPTFYRQGSAKVRRNPVGMKRT